jgi:hypothetical protein
LVGGKLYSYAAGTTTPLATFTDAGGATPNANPVILDSRGEASVWLGTAVYKFALYTSTNVLVWTVDNVGGFATLAQLAASGGSALIGFLQAGTGAVATTVQAKLRESVSVLDFGADPTGVADSTAAIQAAINDVQAVSGDPTGPSFAGGAALGILVIPAGVYKITSPLVITKPCVIRGDGIRRTVIRFSTSDISLFAFEIGPTANNTNLIGGSFGDMTIICNGGAAVGSGVYMSTAAVGSATTVFTLHDLVIYNCRIGVSQTGVIYMCTFRNISVTGNYGGSVVNYGWYAASPQEIIYNSYTDLEVTACGNGAYAYYFQVLASQFRNLSADAPCYFSNPYGAVKGLSIEGLAAATVPTPVVVTLNQCDALEDVAIINCPTAKTSTGISVIGRCQIRNVRWPDNGAGNQPAQPLTLTAGSKGTVQGWQVGRAVTNKVETGNAAAEMNNWVFTACADITDHNLTYQIGTWTPTYPTNWSTNPTLVSAQYTRVGRQVTITMYAQDGVATAGAVIGGLPFTANSTQGAAAYGCSSDPADVLRGSIVPNGVTITNIPAVTLTGNFWQMTATYFV